MKSILILCIYGTLVCIASVTTHAIIQQHIPSKDSIPLLQHILGVSCMCSIYTTVSYLHNRKYISITPFNCII